MANLNKVMLIGRLTRDPEMRTTPGGMAVCSFGLAVNRRRKGPDGNWIEETAFVDITAFGRQGEVIGQYMGKGRQLFVEGHLRFEKWQAQDGSNRQRLSVVVENFQFLDGRDDSEGGQGGGYQQGGGGGYQQGGGGGGGFGGSPQGYQGGGGAPQGEAGPPQGGGSSFDENDEIPF